MMFGFIFVLNKKKYNTRQYSLKDILYQYRIYCNNLLDKVKAKASYTDNTNTVNQIQLLHILHNGLIVASIYLMLI